MWGPVKYGRKLHRVLATDSFESSDERRKIFYDLLIVLRRAVSNGLLAY